MRKLKYILSNSGKFHHFEVAKILYKRNQLEKIICGYPWFKLKDEKISKRFVESQGIYNILKYPIRNNSYFQKFSDYLGVLNKKNMRIVRPGLGLSPKYYDILIGKKVNKDVKKGTAVQWDLVY